MNSPGFPAFDDVRHLGTFILPPSSCLSFGVLAEAQWHTLATGDGPRVLKTCLDVVASQAPPEGAVE